MDPSVLLAGSGIALSLVVTIITILCTTVPVIAIFGGIGYMLVKRSRQRSQALASSRTWMTATGLVIKSRVEVSGGDTASVSPKVVYTYEVDGKLYENSVVRAGDQFMAIRRSGDAYNIIDRYPEGKTVTVYYNPQNPQDSALER